MKKYFPTLLTPWLHLRRQARQIELCNLHLWDVVYDGRDYRVSTKRSKIIKLIFIYCIIGGSYLCYHTAGASLIKNNACMYVCIRVNTTTLCSMPPFKVTTFLCPGGRVDASWNPFVMKSTTKEATTIFKAVKPRYRKQTLIIHDKYTIGLFTESV